MKLRRDQQRKHSNKIMSLVKKDEYAIKNNPRLVQLQTYSNFDLAKSAFFKLQKLTILYSKDNLRQVEVSPLLQLRRILYFTTFAGVRFDFKFAFYLPNLVALHCSGSELGDRAVSQISKLNLPKIQVLDYSQYLTSRVLPFASGSQVDSAC